MTADKKNTKKTKKQNPLEKLTEQVSYLSQKMAEANMVLLAVKKGAYNDKCFVDAFSIKEHHLSQDVMKLIHDINPDKAEIFKLRQELYELGRAWKDADNAREEERPLQERIHEAIANNIYDLIIRDDSGIDIKQLEKLIKRAIGNIKCMYPEEVWTAAERELKGDLRELKNQDA